MVQFLFNGLAVDHGRSRRRAVALAVDLAAKGVLLQVEEPGGALNIGQRIRSGFLYPAKYLPR